MSDQTVGIPPEDTPQDAPGVTSDTPDAGTATDQPDWQKRYQDVQAWATQLAQEKAQLDDPDYRQQLLEQWGYQVGDDEPDLPADDPTAAELEALREQVTQLSQWQQGLTSDQQRQQAYSAYRTDVDPQLKEMGVPEAFLEQTAEIAFDHLPPIQTPAGPKPDLEGAVKQVQELAKLFAQHPEARSAVLADWKQSKQAPHISQVGTAGTQALPEDATHAQRVEWALERLNADQ